MRRGNIADAVERDLKAEGAADPDWKIGDCYHVPIPNRFTLEAMSNNEISATGVP